MRLQSALAHIVFGRLPAMLAERGLSVVGLAMVLPSPWR